jgi:hypothetical protein
MPSPSSSGLQLCNKVRKCINIIHHPQVIGNLAFQEYNRNHSPEFDGRGEPQDLRRGNLADKHHEKLKSKGSPQKGKQSGSFKSYPTCKRCGKAHLGKCKLGTDSCYACDQTGHYVANCPSIRIKDKGVGITMSKGMVFSLDGKKAQANKDLIGGKCFVGQNPIRVLFDYSELCE